MSRGRRRRNLPTIALTDRRVRALGVGPTQIDYWDTNMRGFGVRISAQGRKSWVLRYRTNGRQRRLTLGTFPSLGLAAARVAARSALGDVARGDDPAATKQAEQRAGTFRELADLYLEKHARRRKRSWRADERMLNVDLLPVLGATRAKDVTRREVRALIEAIAHRGAPILANRTLALLRKVFNFGLDDEFPGLEGNPCARITPPGVEQRRDRVLTPDEIKRVWTALDRVHPLTAAVFRLRLLTAQRGGEVLGMQWDELHLEDETDCWWTIPAERSKNKLPHRVPLSPPVVEILEGLARTDGHWVFPSPTVKDQRIRYSAKAMAKVRERSGVDFVAHDLRRTAASMMASAGVNRVVIGKILNHAEPGVTAVYDRHSYDPEKRAALNAWGVRVEQILGRADPIDQE